TGAVKITPAHDFNDFEVGKRHQSELVPPINIFDAEAKLLLADREVEVEGRPVLLIAESNFLEGLPKSATLDSVLELNGLDRFEARTRIISLMEKHAFVMKIEPTTHTVPHGDRSGVAIEPWLTDQWYVNAAELAKPAMAAVRSGKTRFVPERFAADYFR